MASLAGREATMRRREFISLVGGAVAWPLVARAQPIENKCRIAMVSTTWDRTYPPLQEFFKELSRSGYVEGQNIIVEFFSTDGNSERRSEIAHDAVRGNPDAIFVVTAPLIQQVRDVSATIPIAGCEACQKATGYRAAKAGTADH